MTSNVLLCLYCAKLSNFITFTVSRFVFAPVLLFVDFSINNVKYEGIVLKLNYMIPCKWPNL